MKTVDNFKLIKEFIEKRPCDPDQFYFVQILVRGKDGHLGEPGINGNNKNRMVRYYNVHCPEDLDKFEKEMKILAEINNARIYIHPARRSYKKVTNKMLLEFATMINNESYKMIKSAFPTAAGKVYDERVYIVDIDDVELTEETKKEYIEKILECSEDNDLNRIFGVVPTVHGFHIICQPFNVKKYSEMVGKAIDECVKKNNPTLLYYKANESNDDNITPEVLVNNGFRYEKNDGYAIYKTFFEVDGVLEEKDRILIDFIFPESSLIRHTYLLHHDGYKDSLKSKEYTGSISTLKDLNDLLKLIGIDKSIQ